MNNDLVINVLLVHQTYNAPGDDAMKQNIITYVGHLTPTSVREAGGMYTHNNDNVIHYSKLYLIETIDHQELVDLQQI